MEDDLMKDDWMDTFSKFTPFLIAFGLIAAVLIAVVVLFYGREKNETANKSCYKCSRRLGDVSSIAYVVDFARSQRLYCADHPTSKSYEIDISHSQYKTMYRGLDRQSKKKFEAEGKMVSSTKIDDIFTITEEYNYEQKKVMYKIEFMDEVYNVANSHVGVYAITNIHTGKKYIGQSVNIEKRWAQHLREEKIDGFHEHINSYNFKFEKLISCDRVHLDFFEAYFIKKYNTYHNGYNLTKGNYSHITASQMRAIEQI